jgi:hypothetical protein
MEGGVVRYGTIRLGREVRVQYLYLGLGGQATSHSDEDWVVDVIHGSLGQELICR